MNERELKSRFKQLAVRMIRVGDALPRTRSGEAIGRQIVRCGTSPFANYRAACRAKSPADFVAKLAIVEEELDESGAWLELLAECEMVKPMLLEALCREINELLAIVVASIKTARPRIATSRAATIQNPKSKIQNRPGASRC